MTSPNTGNSTVFFDDQVTSTVSDNLISAQVDPSQPQINGLSPVTNPLVADRHLSSRLAGFDPEQFDLSDTSLLYRFLTALIAGSGVGGLRRQQIIARMSAALNGTRFIELDGFWGGLFSLVRDPTEQLPLGDSGTAIDPSSDVADSFTWDTAESRDGRYRSRIEQLARGFAHGATYNGIYLAAKAVLNCEVEIIESWMLADYATDGTVGFVGNTWLAVALQYGTWGALDGVTWESLVLGEDGVSAPLTQTPIGNRGEVIIVPGRVITEAERYQLHLVLDKLLPAGMMATIAPTPFVSEQTVPCRSVASDSVDWTVVSSVNQQQAVDTQGVDLYPNQTDYEGARPALSQYVGEQWTINGRIAAVTAYAEDPTGHVQATIDYQSVTYADGTSHDYIPGDAMIDSRQLALARAASEGVATTFPYAKGRIS
jgi:hypothetical protein